MKKDKGTNYIDNRFPCKDIVKHVVADEGRIALLGVHGLLYIVIFD